MVIWMAQFCLYVSVWLLVPERYAQAQLHPDIYLTLEQRIKRHGYPVEIHKVTTEDGYILSVYRIPHGMQKSQGESKNRSAVLLMHGMGGCPHNWVLLGAKDSLPYYLADRGFDVWLGTVRGGLSAFKRQHVKYDWIDDPEYWDFSLHEMGMYDLAANIDYIISHSDQSKVFFVGHSAGTPMYFILLSERPEYNEKIKIGVQYASAPILKNMENSFVLLLCSLTKVWRGVIKYFGLHELFPQMYFLVPFLKEACQDPKFIKICVNVAGMIGTHNSVLMEENIAALAVTSVPRISTKLLMHFVDNVNDDDFRKYNYGAKKNMRVYGQKEPPRYNLSMSLAPVAFFHGPSDGFCVPEAIQESITRIPNVILTYDIQHPKYTHIDFIVARNSTYLLYVPTYKLFTRYDEGKIPANIGNRSISIN